MTSNEFKEFLAHIKASSEQDAEDIARMSENHQRTCESSIGNIAALNSIKGADPVLLKALEVAGQNPQSESKQ